MIVFGLHLLHFHLHIHLRHKFHGPPFDYWGLAAACFASWVGLPGPGEPVLFAAGVLAGEHKLAIGPVLGVAFLTAVAGGIVGWLIGLFAGRRLLTAPGPLLKLRLRAIERGEEVFKRYVAIAVILTPAFVAGIHRVRTPVYMLWNAVSAAIWAVGIGLAAYFVGPPVIDFVNDIGWLTAVGVGVLVAAGVAIELRRRRGRRAVSP